MPRVSKNFNNIHDLDHFSSTRVEINLPSKIKVDLVQANELKHYEINFWLCSLFASAAAGFWTALLTSSGGMLIFAVASVFTLFTFGFGLAAKYYRSQMISGSVKKVASLDNFN